MTYVPFTEHEVQQFIIYGLPATALIIGGFMLSNYYFDRRTQQQNPRVKKSKLEVKSSKVGDGW